MSVSRRNFLGGALASITLIFGGFGWREDERLSVIEARKRCNIPAIEQLRAAKHMLEENDVLGPFKFLISEGQHEDLLQGQKRAYIIPDCEVIKWQRLG